MDTPLILPEGFSARPCVLPDVESDDIRSEWTRPSFDLDGSTIVVVEDATGTLEAQGEVTYGQRPTAASTRTGADGGSGRGSSSGRRTVRVRRGPHASARPSSTRRPTPPAPPDGYTIRDFVPGTDDGTVQALIDTSFLEWSDRAPESLEDWRATISRPGFEPGLLPVLTTTDGTIVGAAILMDTSGAHEGWVQQLAVAREHRGLGLGRALLDESFGRFRSRGRRACCLNTDSRTGALGLYEHVGMSVTRSYTHRALYFGDSD